MNDIAIVSQIISNVFWGEDMGDKIFPQPSYLNIVQLKSDTMITI